MSASMKTRACQLVFEKSHFSHPKSRHKQCIRHHFYNSDVEVFIPGATALDQNFLKTFTCNDEPVFCVKDVPLSFLINEEFLNAFIRNGIVCALSINSDINRDDCISITPEGELLLHVKKSTYFLLELEGKHSLFSDKYIIKVDLKNEKFYTGKAYYNQVKRAFIRSNIRFDILLTWTPIDNKVWAGSVGAYFTNNGFKTSQQPQRFSLRKFNDLSIPCINSAITEDANDQFCDYLDLHEWLGAISCGINCSKGGSDDFLSTFSVPSLSEVIKLASFQKISGMITSKNLEEILQKIRDHVKASKIPWAALTVHGFPNSPTSWYPFEHGFSICGDNHFTFIIFADDSYWLYKGLGANDVIS